MSVPAWLAKRLQASAVNTEAAPATTTVNTLASPKRPVNTDRHKPGYMAEYMRKRRATK